MVCTKKIVITLSVLKTLKVEDAPNIGILENKVIYG